MNAETPQVHRVERVDDIPVLLATLQRLKVDKNGVGCGITLGGFGGFLLSSMGALIWFANGLALEGASKDVSLVGHLGILGGAVLSVVGSIVAMVGRSWHPGEDQRDARLF